MAVNAAIYARTSGPQSASIPDQISICRKRCEERGWKVRFILKDEGMSGGDPSRPGYQALWDHIDAGEVDVLVTWKMDRIARSLAEMASIEEALRELGVSLHSCTELVDTTNAQGRFVFGILASASELERSLGRDRVMSILSERAARGMWMHATAPFGYCLGKGRSLRILPPEAAVVESVFDVHARLGSYSEVASALNQQGVLRRNRRWTAGTIQRVLTNTMHVGHYEHWGNKVNNPRLRVVSDAAWELSASRRRERPRAGAPASQVVRDAAIERVFDQYLKGLEFLDAEPTMPRVVGATRSRAA